MNLLNRLPALVRIPHAGDDHRLWITDYPTALPDPTLANRGAEGKTCKGTAH
jgi:hypothetical protein